MVGRIIASCITDCGRVREKNEDNLYFDGRCMEQEHRKLDKAVTICRETREASFFGVFDGVGGESFGEVASYLAAAGLHHARQGYDPARQGIEEFLEAVCRMVNGRICREAQERKVRGMGSTAAILAFYGEKVCLCNLGDSPIFRYREGILETIHQEHTNRGFLREQGLDDRKPALTQCLGIPEEEFLIQPHISQEKIREGEQYLICSDGLTDMMGQEEIREILEESLTPGACVEKLRQLALERGGRDNVTIILCRVVQMEEENSK